MSREGTMAGGTLVISREVNNHLYYEKRLEAAGFPDVTVTALEKDALYFLIRDLKPNILLLDARFLESCTPFLMGELKRMFPTTKMAAVSIGEYPADLAMYFIINGAYSYISTADGLDKFFDILAEIGRGRECVSPEVVERIALRREYPIPAGKITLKQKEVIRLICCGYRETEMADTLHISRKTLNNHKTQIFTALNVRNSVELITAAITLKIVNLDELNFHHKNFTVNPKPDKQPMRREKRGIGGNGKTVR
ncbi:MAG: LuxR C-terminal-related transcriptional regulator [Treponema sp.]|jgi:DNA-binding NarL/FixJ family response regulator|nr:LuxR C-terminal-related transcriptional regulator [Treponema sp.]